MPPSARRPCSSARRPTAADAAATFADAAAAAAGLRALLQDLRADGGAVAVLLKGSRRAGLERVARDNGWL